DSPHGNGTTGGAVSAPIFHRIAEATLRHLGIAPTLNPNSPVLIARDRSAEGAPLLAPFAAAAPALSLIRDTPPGTVPDVRGMSAREAARRLVGLGLAAPRLAGNGLVVSQS